MSKKNVDLARKIIEQKASFEKLDKGYIVDLTTTLGIRNYYVKSKEKLIENSDGEKTPLFDPLITTKKEATELAAKHVSTMLDDGSLVISPNWIKDTIK